MLSGQGEALDRFKPESEPALVRDLVDTPPPMVRPDGRWYDPPAEGDYVPRTRKLLYSGKRAPDGEKVTMPRGTWHIEPDIRWSESREFGICEVVRHKPDCKGEPCDCPICGTVLAAGLPPGGQKYCSIGDCARIGANAVRRANRHRKRHLRFRRDADGWYINAPIPPAQEPAPDSPYVHVYQPVPLFRHHRLTPPWMGRTHRIVDLRTGQVKNRYQTVTVLDQKHGRFVSKSKGKSKGRITNVEVILAPTNLASCNPVSR